jgi:hypothetical protein
VLLNLQTAVQLFAETSNYDWWLGFAEWSLVDLSLSPNYTTAPGFRQCVSDHCLEPWTWLEISSLAPIIF